MEPGIPFVGIVAAFRREVAPLLRQGGQVARLNGSTYRLSIQGAPMVLAISGIGSENAFTTAVGLLGSFPLRGLFSVGFAGGLKNNLQPGAVVAAEEIIDEATGEQYPCATILSSETFAEKGSLLCAREVVSVSADKHSLAAKWGAVAVDMESAGVARAAAQAGIPCGALKSITDPLQQSMAIDFQRCRSEDGKLLTWKIVREGLASREGFRDLWRLAANSRRAATRLAIALGAI